MIVSPLTSPRLLGVLELGSSWVRCTVAEDRPEGPRVVEDLHLPSRVGEEIFRTQHAGMDAMDEVVRSFEKFATVLRTYDVAIVRAVASSAVAGASNADILLERIRSACGIALVALDAQEETRLMLAALQPHLDACPRREQSLAVDLSGASAEFVFLDKGRPRYATSANLGTLRLRVLFESIPSRRRQVQTLVEHLDASFCRVLGNLPEGKVASVVGMGRDANLIAELASDKSGDRNLAILNSSTLAPLARALLGIAETGDPSLHDVQVAGDRELLGYAALFYHRLLDVLGSSRLIVPRVSLRDGILRELIVRNGWEDQGRTDSILFAARGLARRYGGADDHSEHVRKHSVQLFDLLMDLHRMGSHDRALLEIAALLHEIGHWVNPRSHHKHTAYLVESSELPGLSRRDLRVVAQVGRYHRRSPPRLVHPGFATLDPEDRVRVRKLAALLRVADALDADHRQVVQLQDLRRDGDRILLGCSGKPWMHLERLALQAKADLFQETFGIDVQLVLLH